MAHRLYHPCLMHVNKPITVHLNNGTSHYGILNRVASNGIYLAPANGYASAKKTNRIQVENADNQNMQYSNEVEEAFWPFFIPFALLAGFTLGFATGAIVTRPFYW